MSNIVGGSVSIGRGDNQVVLMFSGTLEPDQWAAFVESIVETAHKFNVAVKPFGEQLVVQHQAVGVDSNNITGKARPPK